MNEKKLGAATFFDKTRRIAELAKRVEAKEITGQTGGEIFAWILETPETASIEEHIRKQGLAQVSDAGALEAVVLEVIAKNARIVADIKGGKATAIQALVGQVMKDTKGKANANLARELLLKALG
jgi:aspartyl-tRNA(Asn)/glutamyl-tRNA(Gln) amidotransferase subunit B